MMKIFNVIPESSVALGLQKRLLDSFFDNWMMPSTNPATCGWIPVSDITETDTEYHVTMEIPGIDMKKLDITYSEGVLTIKGEKTTEISIGESCFCSERYVGDFQRSFRIPGKVDTENIEATYKDGILRVSLIKSKESIIKKIEIH